MKPISDALLDALETEATAWVKELAALRAYQGDDHRYYAKGKLAVGIISGLALMRASESNRMAVEMAAGKDTGRRASEAVRGSCPRRSETRRKLR